MRSWVEKVRVQIEKAWAAWPRNTQPRRYILLTLIQNLVPGVQEWEKAESIPDSIYQQAAADGLLMPIAAGPTIPAAWKGKYPIIGNISADEWDGFHDLIVHDEIGRTGGIG